MGDVVLALGRITEPGFKKDDDFAHALEGDEGRVQLVDLDQGFLTVTWRRHGTTTDVHETEVEASGVRAAAG